MVKFNRNSLEVSYFHNGESRIKDICEDIRDENLVDFIFKTDYKNFNVNEDLFYLLFIANEVKKWNVKTTLRFWCMPYQRMDRKCVNDIFTLEAVCKYINWLKFDKIIIVDPHSDVTLKLLKNAEAIYPIVDWLPGIKEKIGFTDEDYIVFPDEGAQRRYSKYNLGEKICYCKKKRNEITNFIVNSKVVKGNIKEGCKCIIIDDLCSSGSTLLKCSELLNNMGASEIYIVVTHCEAACLKSDLLSEDSKVVKLFTSPSNMYEHHKKIEYLDIF